MRRGTPRAARRAAGARGWGRGTPRADEVELEGRLELRVRHVRLFEAERRRPHKALKLWRLAREGLADEGDLAGGGCRR